MSDAERMRVDAEEAAADGGEAAIRAGLFARSGDLLTTEGLSGRTVLLVGAGSVGSVAAETLTRAGLGNLIVVDHDVVSAENLSRCSYEAQDVGSAKTLALARRLSQINPALNVTQHYQRVEDFDLPDLLGVLGACDVALIATDDNDTQARMNLLTYAHAVPAVFPGLYDGALGGEIAVVVPRLTACHRCVVADRPSADDRPTSASQAVDYSTGRLKGVVALASDIHHVTGVAAKIVLSLLALASGDRAAISLPDPSRRGSRTPCLR